MRGLLLIFNYNHEVEIGAVLDEVLARKFPLDLLLLDDCSTDNSWKIAEAKGIPMLRSAVNSGIGNSLRNGINHAISHGYDFVSLMSANGKVRPEDIPRLMAPVVSGEADYVTGSRFMRGGGSPGLTLFRRLAIPIFSIFASLIMGRIFSDITCGARCYRLDFIVKGQKEGLFDISQSWLNRYEMEYYIHYWASKMKIRIKQIPIVIPYTHLEKNRISHIKPVTGWWSMIRPLVFLKFGMRK